MDDSPVKLKQHEISRGTLDNILLSLLGSDTMVARWWLSPNLSFNMMTPNEMMGKDPNRVKSYILGQLNGDYS